MEKISRAEIMAINQNLHVFLGFMRADIQTMLAEGTDRTVNRSVTRDLDEQTLERLKTVLGRITGLRQKIEGGNGEKVFIAEIDDICNCSIHLKHLKGIGILSLADFFWPEDPLRFHDALHEAEKEAKGVRQPHLFIGMQLKFIKLVKKASKRRK